MGAEEQAKDSSHPSYWAEALAGLPGDLLLQASAKIAAFEGGLSPPQAPPLGSLSKNFSCGRPRT